MSKISFQKSFQIVFIIIPFLIFGFALYIILWDLFNSQENKLTFTIVEGIFVISVSLAMLSFNYASVLPKTGKKYKVAMYCGERFLQATLFAIIGFVLIYLGSKSIAWYYIGRDNWLKSTSFIFGTVLRMLGFPFILWGVTEVDFAIKKVWFVANIGRNVYNTDDIREHLKLE
jgi:hypothetical protein